MGQNVNEWHGQTFNKFKICCYKLNERPDQLMGLAVIIENGLDRQRKKHTNVPAYSFWIKVWSDKGHLLLSR